MNSVAPGRARTRLVATLASVVAIVTCLVLLVLLVTSSHKTDGQKLAGDRSSAAAVANAFITALGTYDRSLLQGTQMPAYRAKVEALLTPKFGVAFESSGAPKAEQAVGKASLKETVQIWSTGVAAINDAQATVLVVGALTDFVPKTAGGTDYQSLGETPFRTVVTLVKDGNGAWLVDGQAPAEGIPPLASGSASAAPTSGASK